MNEEFKKFEESYSQLNQSQKEAVDAIDGPVMVVAGPGTGKTKTLTLRIANILRKTQMNPRNILALTFTEQGASEMKRRLFWLIGSEAYDVGIFTFHGFCNDVIQTYADEFQDILGRAPSNEIQRIQFIKRAIDEVKSAILKPFGDRYYYVKSVLRAIGDMKREAILANTLGEANKKNRNEFEKIEDLYYESGKHTGAMKGKYAEIKKQIEKNEALAEIYKKYEEILKKEKRYDYDDMIVEVVKTLEENREFLLRLQEKYQYFLVDEHQDTNNAQNRVLELLCNFYSNPNLFVVGDEKQAIFRFQGASLENFLYFKNLYPEARLIMLKENYRSSRDVLNAAGRLIQKNSRKISDVLQEIIVESLSPTSDERGFVEMHEFSSPEIELYFVVKKVSWLIESGENPKEIAVIYRDNSDAVPLSEMFQKYGVPFRIESNTDVFEDDYVKNLILIFRFLDDFPSDEKLFNMLHSEFFGLQSLDIYKLSVSRERRKPRFTLLDLMKNFSALENAGVSNSKKIKLLADRFERWHSIAKNKTFPELFEVVVHDSGMLASILSRDDSEMRLNRIHSLFSEVKRFAEEHPRFSLHDFLEYCDALEEHGVRIREERVQFMPRAVRCMTAHGAKGLEFDFVFIINVYDGHWGNRKARELIRLPKFLKSMPEDADADGVKNDDERRLFYVALTRARKTVFVSYAKSDINGKTLLPSLFLDEIGQDYLKEGDSGIYEKNFEKEKKIIFSPRLTDKFSVFEKEYVAHLFRERGLYATALNNFLECPWKYFYVNLLGVPMAKEKHQMYGTAVHAALKKFFEVERAGKGTRELLLENFRAALEEENLAESEFEETLERGLDALGRYYDAKNGSWNKNIMLEYSVPHVFLNDDLKLTGKIDKIEFLEGRRNAGPVRNFSGELTDTAKRRRIISNGVNVVDYKTGKPKSRNELFGKTKNATGNELRQLVFYKLLLDRQRGFMENIVSGEIEFIEPDKKGNFHSERFAISEEEVSGLEKLVREVSEKILSLSFWNDRCGDKTCEFCKLRDVIGA